MDRLLYTSVSALRGAMARQAATANNLANASTTGFRAEMANVRPLWVQGTGFGSRAVASEEVVAADMDAGAVGQTGRPLDVALSGDALLAVQANDGTEGYTRRGDLSTTDSGLLVNGEGLPVIGDGGPITLPPYDRVQIDAGGGVMIAPAGADPQAPLQKIDQLKLVSAKGSEIKKSVDGLFRVDGGGALPGDPEARLESGALEGSNVNASQALIDMIEASRDWETQIKLVASTRELDTDSAALMRID